MKIGEVEFLLGADPEAFVYDKKLGKLVSAYGMLPGTKDEPFKVKGGAIQVDGMAAEFNIDPARTYKEFRTNIRTVVKQIEEMLGDRYRLSFVPVAHFGKEYIESQPEEARELGCNPDYNAWTGEMNVKPNVETPFRTAAGHIHIGWGNNIPMDDERHKEMCMHVVRNLDYYCVPTLKIDKDTTRRQLYGGLGAFRPKPYGVEYRTPSNFWLKNENNMKLMYNIVRNVLKVLVSGHKFYVKGFDAPLKQTLKSTYEQGLGTGYIAYTEKDADRILSRLFK